MSTPFADPSTDVSKITKDEQPLSVPRVFCLVLTRVWDLFGYEVTHSISDTLLRGNGLCLFVNATGITGR